MISDNELSTEQKIVRACLNACVPPDRINEVLVANITKLLEQSYSIGYDDGREIAEIKHKQHVMKVLKQELENYSVHRNRR